MNHLLATLAYHAQSFPAAEGDIDDDGYWTTTNWLIPEQAELIYGGLASVIIIGLLIWKAGPAAKQAFVARTARVEEELEEAAQAQAGAEAEAARIHGALGDIEAERRRILAEADTQAEALLADGRARLDAEIAELEAKSEADIGTSVARASDELRIEIARTAATAAEQVVERSLNDETRQRLIEDYIQRVGASNAAKVGT